MNTSGISAYVIQLKDHHNGPLVCDYLKDLLPYVRSNTTWKNHQKQMFAYTITQL